MLSGRIVHRNRRSVRKRIREEHVGEMCSGMIGPSFTNEAASGPTVVVPGKSIGPISVGMTRREITRVARPQGRGYMGSRFRVRGMHVYVGYGRWGRARRLFAASSKLVVRGVSISEGPDRLAQSLPALYLARCEGTLGGPTEGDLRGSPWIGITEFGWYAAPSCRGSSSSTRRCDAEPRCRSPFDQGRYVNVSPSWSPGSPHPPPPPTRRR